MKNKMFEVQKQNKEKYELLIAELNESKLNLQKSKILIDKYQPNTLSYYNENTILKAKLLQTEDEYQGYKNNTGYELFELRKYKQEAELYKSKRGNIILDIKSDIINWEFLRTIILI
jgi:hypothetical protein